MTTLVALEVRCARRLAALIVMFRRHQYERAPAMARALDGLATCVLLKRIEFAAELQNRRRDHGGRPVACKTCEGAGYPTGPDVFQVSSLDS